MADGLPRLILFSIAMAAASFAAGMLPLSLSLSKNKLRLLSTVGMGVLVGTSLIVIIPEGIETLYNAAAAPTSSHLDRREDHDHDDDDDDHGSSSPHAYIGLALIAGFILMYLIDTLPALVQQHTSPSQPSYITLNALRTPNPNTDPHSSNGDAPRPTSSPTPSSSSFSTTAGLVIHACADGIALGASSTSSNLGLELIIFIAIMLHKAPAAFGLSAVLLKKGLGKRTARAHLVVFSLAAPFGALVTWAIIAIAGGVGDKERMAWWTGVLLLFSGGTFLYVAMHTMQESTAGSHGHGDADDRDGLEEEGYMMAPKKHGHTGPSVQDTAAAVVGMLVPLVTQIGHSHAHAH